MIQKPGMQDSAPSADLSQLDPAEARRGASALLEHLQRLGVTHLPVAQKPVSLARAAAGGAPQQRQSADNIPQPAAARPGATRPAAEVAASPPQAAPVAPRRIAPEPTGHDAGYGPPLPVIQRQQQLADLSEQVAACTACAELARARTNTVFGEGNPEARICFFGEAPGVDEDRSGRPFVGRAGQLLTKIIEATTFRREDVYILNTIKCRPPGNRNPLPDEVANCRHFFESQLEIIQPEYIVCLGLVSARALLPEAASIGRMRGRFHTYRGSKVVVTYHPAYLLRNPQAKRAVWEDMQMMMRAMGIR